MTEPWHDVPLVDHHCHGVVDADLDRDGFEALMNEADGPAPGTSLFDSMLGLAIRRWCAPVLYLPIHATPDEYLQRRAELGWFEVKRRFFADTGITNFLVDSGYRADELAAPLGGRVHDIVRLETLAEDVVRAGTTAAEFANDCGEALAKRAATAVGCKSIAAYRVGLRLAGERPSDADVEAAAGEWLSNVDAGGTVRLASPVLHRFLVWLAIENRLPVQFHVGYGDSDVDLAECDPLLMTDLLRATRSYDVPILLLHNYPFHRHAAYLAQVFPHVYLDLGLTTHNVGYRSGAVITETLELAPFGKFLFSTDAFGLPELYHLGTLLFRRGLGRFLKAGVAEDMMSVGDALYIAQLIGNGNARRIYRLN